MEKPFFLEEDSETVLCLWGRGGEGGGTASGGGSGAALTPLLVEEEGEPAEGGLRRGGDGGSGCGQEGFGSVSRIGLWPIDGGGGG